MTGWDCHAHVFGPYDHFPLAVKRVQTPPEATEAQYLAMLGRLGLSNGVLVHASPYGNDHTLLMHVLARQPQLRGIIVALPGSSPSFVGLRAKGVRGARFSHRPGADFPGSASIHDLEHMASALAAAGLHAELWTTCKALPDIELRLRRLPVPVVIDHMGGFDVSAGIDEPGFRTLLRLLEDGHVLVKLCAYRNLLGAVDVDAGRVFQDALLDANPAQLVWGSDWPHLRVSPVPDALQLLDNFKRWTGDAALAQRVLVDNPAQLYA